MSSKNDSVRRVFETSRRGSGRNARLACPFCARRGHRGFKANLSLDTVTGLWYCHRCGEGGGLKGFAPQDEIEASAPTFELPPGIDLSESTWSDPLVRNARDYLLSRGVEDYQARIWGMRACFDGPFAGRVVIPIWDSGKVEGYVGRDWTGKNPLKYRYAQGMQRARLLGGFDVNAARNCDLLLVAEGMLDVVSLTEKDALWGTGVWADSVAVLGTPTEKQLERLGALPYPVVFVLDGDAWRKAEACALTLRLMGHAAGWVRLPAGKDPDEVDYSWLIDEAQKSIQPGEAI